MFRAYAIISQRYGSFVCLITQQHDEINKQLKCLIKTKCLAVIDKHVVVFVSDSHRHEI